MLTIPLRRSVALAALAGALLVSTLANARSGNNDGVPSPGPDGILAVTISHTNAGDALAGPNGMTLYVLTRDHDGSSSCIKGSCARRWPAFEGDALQIRLGSGVSGTFATTTWSDGTTQIVHNGQALYYYYGDAAPGDARGQKPGNGWLVAPVGDSSVCQPQPGSAQDPEPTFDAPGPARHASDHSGGEY
jgi:predicted lipoprotein with Yx(FWY)xxD motif